MSLSYKYGFIDESRANHFRLYELFDIERLKNELDNISIEIEKLGFNITVGYKKRPEPKDQLYEYPAFRWELVCQVKLKKNSYRLNIVSAFNGIYLYLYQWNGDYINDRNLLEFVFGDINRSNIFTKDLYQLPSMIKDLIKELDNYGK